MRTRMKLFSGRERYGRMTQPDIWYVAFGPDKAVKTDDSATGLVRSTKTFKSEVDAKLFAMQILAKGWSATAGTLNPHQPKQIVGSSQIERWADPGLGGCNGLVLPGRASSREPGIPTHVSLVLDSGSACFARIPE